MPTNRQLPLARSLVSQTIDCPDYVAVQNSKRCRHYLSNGSCGRSDRFMCQEWLKANGYEVATERRKPPKPLASPGVDSGPTVDPLLTLRLLRHENLEQLKAQALEVCLAPPDLGELWLVPEYTQQDRTELQFDHAATLTAICSVFPGARVISIKTKK